MLISGNVDFSQKLLAKIISKIRSLKEPRSERVLDKNNKAKGKDTSMPLEYIVSQDDSREERILKQKLKDAFFKGYSFGVIDSSVEVSDIRDEILYAHEILSKYDIKS